MSKIEEYLKYHNNNDIHPADLAGILKAVEKEEDFERELKKIPLDIVGSVILILPERYFLTNIKAFELEELKEIIKELESDDQTYVVRMLEENEPELAKELLELLTEKESEMIEQLIKYKEFEAGAYMQVETFTAEPTEIIYDLIKRFSKMKKDNLLSNINKLFVVEENGKLLYTVGLDSLLTFDFNETLQENINKSEDNYIPISGKDTDDIAKVVHLFEEYDLSAMPIINDYGILIGRITSDDVYDIIEEEATEQMYNLAGIKETIDDNSFIVDAIKSRANWLSINLLTAILASLAIGLFSETLQEMVALAILMPIVASMGGNAGTQSLTVVVRQLALEDMDMKTGMLMVKKEVLISLSNGLFFAFVMGIIAYIWFGQQYLGLVIALSMFINLIMAGFFGAAIPLFLKRINVDPAIGSSVVLTTFTDIIGFVTFLGLATLMLF